MSFNGQNQSWERSQSWQAKSVPVRNAHDGENINLASSNRNTNRLYPLQKEFSQNYSSMTYDSIGTVTKVNDECGLVNNEVFFFLRVVNGRLPNLGDQVQFEADASTTGLFKWNAKYVEIIPPPPSMSISNNKGFTNHSSTHQFNNTYESPALENFRFQSFKNQDKPNRPSHDVEHFGYRERDRVNDNKRECENVNRNNGNDANKASPQNVSFSTTGTNAKAPKSQKKKQKLQCKVCKENFVSKPKFEKHQKRFKGDCLKHKQVQYRKCGVCYELLGSKFSLTRHMYKHHRREIPFSCSNCRKKYKYFEELESHVIGKSAKSNKCYSEEQVFQFEKFIKTFINAVNDNQDKRQKSREKKMNGN